MLFISHSYRQEYPGYRCGDGRYRFPSSRGNVSENVLSYGETRERRTAVLAGRKFRMGSLDLQPRAALRLVALFCVDSPEQRALLRVKFRETESYAVHKGKKCFYRLAIHYDPSRAAVKPLPPVLSAFFPQPLAPFPSPLTEIPSFLSLARIAGSTNTHPRERCCSSGTLSPAIM